MAALSIAALAGCAGKIQDYSPDYSYVATDASTGGAKGVSGAMLVPNACLGEPADNPPSPAATDMTFVPELGPHLAPGCANAYNLQLMVENERDLVEGRTLGPAPAAPTARAARRYIHGEEQSLGGAHDAEAVPNPLDAQPD
ncbi:hypothetical protein XW59_024125 [Aquamicrobium sp. LC103]|nr:hypothetical protein XW59_024125 [Aquamicrobium sp. LC103]